MGRFALYPFSCLKTDVGQTPLHFQQLKNFTWNANSQQSDQIPGGSIDVLCSYLANSNPMAMFTTHDLLTFFTNVGPASVLPVTDCQFRMIERAEDGTFETTGDIWQIPKATIVPMSIVANQNDVDGAALQFGVVLLDDGTNAPVSHATAQDFSSVSTPACISTYYLGPMFSGVSQIPNIESVSVQFGINYNAKGFNGSVFPTNGSIVTRNPTITFTTTSVDVDAAANVILRGLDGADLRLFFRRAEANSDRYADNAAQHLQITASGGAQTTESVSVEGNDDGTSSIRITPHGPLTFTLNSLIA